MEIRIAFQDTPESKPVSPSIIRGGIKIIENGEDITRIKEQEEWNQKSEKRWLDSELNELEKGDFEYKGEYIFHILLDIQDAIEHLCKDQDIDLSVGLAPTIFCLNLSKIGEDRVKVNMTTGENLSSEQEKLEPYDIEVEVSINEFVREFLNASEEFLDYTEKFEFSGYYDGFRESLEETRSLV